MNELNLRIHEVKYEVISTTSSDLDTLATSLGTLYNVTQSNTIFRSLSFISFCLQSQKGNSSIYSILVGGWCGTGVHYTEGYFK